MIFLIFQVACSGDEPAESGASEAPVLTLVSPAEGDVVCGTPLVVVTELQNFRLTNETIEDPPVDLGHLHVYLNGQEVAQADDTTVSVNDVADNEYQLSVDIAHADHTGVKPYVGVTVYVTVSATACTP